MCQLRNTAILWLQFIHVFFLVPCDFIYFFLFSIFLSLMIRKKLTEYNWIVFFIFITLTIIIIITKLNDLHLTKKVINNNNYSLKGKFRCSAILIIIITTLEGFDKYIFINNGKGLHIAYTLLIRKMVEGSEKERENVFFWSCTKITQYIEK